MKMANGNLAHLNSSSAAEAKATFYTAHGCKQPYKSSHSASHTERQRTSKKRPHAHTNGTACEGCPLNRHSSGLPNLLVTKNRRCIYEESSFRFASRSVCG